MHIAFSVYLVGMVVAMLTAGRIADNAGRQPVEMSGVLLKVTVSFTQRWHQRNGHNPKRLWLKETIKMLYGSKL